ncbi:MAG: hypothetical protein A3I66_24050 [Burkholderiales bacterium RIFCSPLOWO2_02_FULL_57_36]|nr:MAG: hypothetical protein A3I66_24050 [Burkholderiales bacterium RIFCSPLOWO2_02_FULL_57_36]
MQFLSERIASDACRSVPPPQSSACIPNLVKAWESIDQGTTALLPGHIFSRPAQAGSGNAIGGIAKGLKT